MRLGQPLQMTTSDGSFCTSRKVAREDLQFCVNTATKYSPWSAQTIANGYITAPGGHRIGVCGDTVVQNGTVTGMREIRSLCIRVAGDFPGIARDIAAMNGSILILGSPGFGKTTLLRDLIRQVSSKQTVGVVDQREELFPTFGGVSCFPTGIRTDVMTGCEKAKAIDMLLRTMAPDTVAMDEVTSEEDCNALMNAAWCGVRLIATAHASSRDDLYNRRIYRPLVQNGLFSSLVILRKDKSWRMERIHYDS